MKKVSKLSLLLVGILTPGCTDATTATKALQAQGFTEVHIIGWGGPWECSDSDQFSTRFSAKNPQGQQVEGTVCSGWFKGATVRW